jgi:hypothetical protein
MPSWIIIICGEKVTDFQSSCVEIKHTHIHIKKKLLEPWGRLPGSPESPTVWATPSPSRSWVSLSPVLGVGVWPAKREGGQKVAACVLHTFGVFYLFLLRTTYDQGVHPG